MACTADPIRVADLEFLGMQCANGGGAFCLPQVPDKMQQVPAEDVESVYSDMDMSTYDDSHNDDSCSDCTIDSSSESDSSVEDLDSPFTTEQTLLIFDWDDTVLPSTWIQKQGLRLDDASVVNEDQREELNSMAQCAIRTLRAAKQFGTVVLVTNAERGWIELSCRKFMPTLCPLLESIKIISARARHEKPGVTLPSMWKSLAFRSEINDFYKTSRPEWAKNIISFGDAMHERLAVFQVTSDMSNCYTKSFKFMEQPHLEQLRKEHELIYWCLRHIVRHEGTLDLQVQIA